MMATAFIPAMMRFAVSSSHTMPVAVLESRPTTPEQHPSP